MNHPGRNAPPPRNTPPPRVKRAPQHPPAERRERVFLLRESGFSLVELMIVLAIIALLATTAIPQYQIYTTRAKVSTSLAMTRPLQLAVSEYAAVVGDLPPDSAALAAYGVSADGENYASGDVASVIYDSSQTIVVAYRADKQTSANLRGKTLRIQPNRRADGSVRFSIPESEAGGSLEQRYRPNL